MGFILGRIVGMVILSFLIVHYFSEKRYFKKHGTKMSTSKVVIKTTVLAIVLTFISMLGALQ